MTELSALFPDLLNHDWLPVYIAEEPCLIITESLNFCHREKHLRTNAFVIMPTHMHWIGFDAAFDGGQGWC